MASEKQSNVQIKGIKDGLLVILGEGEWADLRESVFQQILEREAFFKGAKVTLDVGNLILHAAEMGSLRDKLSELGVSLWAVISNSPTTEMTAQTLGLATRIPTPRPDRTVRPLNTNLTTGEEAILLQRTLRSGFKISFQGNVIVVGDVNPGAEIIAGGSVLVWGRVRGTVHAGAEGNENSVVCALDLQPTQLRIANHIAVPPQRKGKPIPEMARVKDGQVIAEEWKTKEK
jgi:septum site-determining protein MinC